MKNIKMQFIIIIILVLGFNSCEKSSTNSETKEKYSLTGTYNVGSGNTMTLQVLNTTDLSFDGVNGYGIYKGRFSNDNCKFDGTMTNGSDKSTINVTLDNSKQNLTWTEYLVFYLNGKKTSTTLNGKATRR